MVDLRIPEEHIFVVGRKLDIWTDNSLCWVSKEKHWVCGSAEIFVCLPPNSCSCNEHFRVDPPVS